ncbi:MAG: sensor histidine kinase, partial [Flavisolibacter sp.]
VWLNEKSNLFKKVDLNQVVKQAALEAGKNLEPGSLVLQVGLLPEIEGDAEQLQLLFCQLFSNAIKFKKNGQAIIQLDATVIKQNIFRAVENKYQYDDYIRLEVKDEGIGFDPVYKDHIFELFRQLHYTEGQGIGLALCKKIVENHSGQIKAESEVNIYTKISIWLPLNRSAVQDIRNIYG